MRLCVEQKILKIYIVYVCLYACTQCIHMVYQAVSLLKYGTTVYNDDEEEAWRS